MSPVCRFLLLLFLVLPQLAAPLLHAHSAARQSVTGIHLPGLESMADSALATPASADDASGQADLFAVDEGMRLDPLLSFGFLLPASLWLLWPKTVFQVWCAVTFPPFVTPLFYPEVAPRAPPAPLQASVIG
ncbi:MAG: hypothetical protein RQ715_09885 [Methylococcales bacterium]|nr:hypothetical protein [Methylococcales bacterium]